MKKISTKERIAIILMIAMLLTNPLTGQYVLFVLDWTFQQMFKAGPYIGLIATSYILALSAFYYIRSEKINIPAKNTKTKSQSYIKY